jgi:hypothetical protein
MGCGGVRRINVTTSRTRGGREAEQEATARQEALAGDAAGGEAMQQPVVQEGQERQNERQGHNKKRRQMGRSNVRKINVTTSQTRGQGRWRQLRAAVATILRGSSQTIWQGKKFTNMTFCDHNITTI